MAVIRLVTDDLCPPSAAETLTFSLVISLRGLSSPLGRGGLVGHAGVALIRGSLGDFHLGAELLLVHQHLRRQTPTAQTGLRRNGRVREFA